MSCDPILYWSVPRARVALEVLDGANFPSIASGRQSEGFGFTVDVVTRCLHRRPSLPWLRMVFESAPAKCRMLHPSRRFESRPAEELHDGTLAGKGFVFISLVKIFRPMASCELVAAWPAEEVLESVLLMPGLGTRSGV
jgi:hypothetical protein